MMKVLLLGWSEEGGTGCVWKICRVPRIALSYWMSCRSMKKRLGHWLDSKSHSSLSSRPRQMKVWLVVNGIFCWILSDRWVVH